MFCNLCFFYVCYFVRRVKSMMMIMKCSFGMHIAVRILKLHGVCHYLYRVGYTYKGDFFLAMLTPRGTLSISTPT